MNKDLYIKQLESRIGSLEKSLKWKMSFNEHRSIFSLVIKILLQSTRTEKTKTVFDEIIKKIQQYPYGPPVISQSIIHKTSKILKEVERKMKMEQRDLLKLLEDQIVTWEVKLKEVSKSKTEEEMIGFCKGAIDSLKFIRGEILSG